MYLIKLRIAVIAIACWPLISFGQVIEMGSIEFLTLDNGYKNLLLGTEINKLPKQRLNFLDNKCNYDADSCLFYLYKDSLMLLMGDDLQFEAVALRTYNNKIVNIYLFFKMEDSYKVLRNFLSAYGMFSSRADDYTDDYNWKSASIVLTLRYTKKNEFGVAIFTCTGLEQMIQERTKRLQASKYLRDVFSYTIAESVF